MLTYRDRTYCINTECKKKCFRKLTDKIEKEAEEFGLPVAVANYDCSKEE